MLLAELLIKYLVTDYTHIKNDKNNGVALGNNQGIKQSLQDGCDYVILLNNDIEFDQTYLFSEMIDLAENKGEDLIVPKIYFYGTNKIWMAGGKILKYKGYTINYGEGEEDGPQYNNDLYCNFAPTCFMLINKKVFADVGLMDEKYFVYFDDTDFLYKAAKKGYRILYHANLKVFHKISSSTGGTGDKESPFSLYYSHRNRLYFIRKNFTGASRLVSLSYTLITRLFKYISYNKENKTIFLKSVKDGFKM